MHEANFLRDALIYLAAAVVCVPLAKRFGLGAVLGYLAAGCLIGPWGLGLISDAASTLRVAELGVVLMLFVIGLELDPKRVWSMRRAVFGGGAAQMALCTAALAGGGLLLGLPWQAALVAGFALALSSTALLAASLTERNLIAAPLGRSAIGLSLFQDIAAIPFIAIVPLLALAPAAGAGHGAGLMTALTIFGAIALLLAAGRWLMPPVLRLIAKSGLREVFTAVALLLVIACAELMELAGASMALGAFIAGVVLAQSEYRHALESDIEPFKGLLLGLFFIAVGMTIDFGLLRAAPLTVATLVLGFYAIKLVLVWLLARPLAIPPQQRLLFAILLATGSEFAFVVFGVAREAAILPGQWDGLLTLAAALSMLATPLLLIAHDAWQRRQLAAQAAARADEKIEDEGAAVIIAGFGRFGQIVGRLLMAHGVRITVLDHDPDQIEFLRKFGYKVFYGDATRIDLLHAAGAARARLLVVAIDQVESSLRLVDIARHEFPHLALVARARNVRHWLELSERGVTAIERETFESALRTGRHALEALGLPPFEARELADTFRRQNIATLRALQPHFRDEAKTVAIAKTGREELEQNLRRDREARDEQRGAQGWQ
jgi:glutathione-regulated potassium-efflux system ancillary protein KefC